MNELLHHWIIGKRQKKTFHKAIQQKALEIYENLDEGLSVFQVSKGYLDGVHALSFIIF